MCYQNIQLVDQLSRNFHIHVHLTVDLACESKISIIEGTCIKIQLTESQATAARPVPGGDYYPLVLLRHHAWGHVYGRLQDR